jgi:GNAT superfamily N-acetyltransferase
VQPKIVRSATIKDISTLAKMSVMAGGGISEFLLEELVPTPSLTANYLEKEINRKGATFHFENFIVSEVQSNIAGIIHFYPSRQRIVPPPQSGIASTKIKALEEFYATYLPPSLYIQSLYVQHAFRRQGIARSLLNHIVEKAQEQNFSALSLHVWEDNDFAISLYKREGFTIQQSVSMPKHYLLPHQTGMFMMCRLI